jgi:hypothetical protein
VEAKQLLKEELEEPTQAPYSIPGPFHDSGRVVCVEDISGNFHVPLDERSLGDFRQMQSACDFCRLICYSAPLFIPSSGETSAARISLQYIFSYKMPSGEFHAKDPDQVPPQI